MDISPPSGVPMGQIRFTRTSTEQRYPSMRRHGERAGDRIARIRALRILRRFKVDSRRYEGLTRTGEPEKFAIRPDHPALTTVDTRLVEAIRRQAESSGGDSRRAAAHQPFVQS
jgi:hypothetical protein